MSAVVRLTWRERLRSWIWPDLPKPDAADRPVDANALALKAYQVWFFAGAGNVSASAEDYEVSRAAEHALHQILTDYRDGLPQSGEELALGRALDHVARVYLEA